jgi:hypothetical protein
VSEQQPARTRISTRYVPGIAVLLLLAAIPVIVHRYRSMETDSCPEWPALVARLETRAGTAGPSRNQEPAGKRLRFLRLWSLDGRYALGELALPPKAGVGRFAIVRSYDAKQVYHRPAVSLIPSIRADARDLEMIGSGSHAIPIHRPRYDRNGTTGRAEVLAGYLLTYDGAAVANPYVAQLRAAPRQLVSGRTPMALFFAWALVRPERRADAEEALLAWLTGAWEVYQATCVR